MGIVTIHVSQSFTALAKGFAHGEASVKVSTNTDCNKFECFLLRVSHVDRTIVYKSLIQNATFEDFNI